MDSKALDQAEALLRSLDEAATPPGAPADLPLPPGELGALCQALWQLVYEREAGGEAGEAIARPLLAMSKLAVLAFPDGDHRREAYLRPLRERPGGDPVKARFEAFEDRVGAARDEAARARQAYLDRYVSPGSFSLELLGDAEPKVLAYRSDKIRGPAILAVHLASPGRADYLVHSEPVENGTHLGPYLDILPPDPATGPRARFDVDGLWGSYEAGRVSYYAHGHEEGDTHDFDQVWGEWVLRKVAAILRRAGRPGTPPGPGG